MMRALLVVGCWLLVGLSGCGGESSSVRVGRCDSRGPDSELWRCEEGLAFQSPGDCVASAAFSRGTCDADDRVASCDYTPVPGTVITAHFGAIPSLRSAVVAAARVACADIDGFFAPLFELEVNSCIVDGGCIERSVDFSTECASDALKGSYVSATPCAFENVKTVCYRILNSDFTAAYFTDPASCNAEYEQADF